MLHSYCMTKVPAKKVVAYIQRYGLLTVEEARKWGDFLSNPFYRSYIFTYRYGGEMLDALFATQDDRDHCFARLLTEPVTPSWMDGRERWTAFREEQPSKPANMGHRGLWC